MVDEKKTSAWSTVLTWLKKPFHWIMSLISIIAGIIVVLFFSRQNRSDKVDAILSAGDKDIHDAQIEHGKKHDEQVEAAKEEHAIAVRAIIETYEKEKAGLDKASRDRAAELIASGKSEEITAGLAEILGVKNSDKD